MQTNEIAPKHNPSVSVIIPAYQCAGLLPRAIQSVREQKHPFIEIIIVDNGSTDDTGKVAADFASQDNRIKVVRLANNQGPAGARNMGIKEAKGELIGFLDADDEWLPEKLTKQVGIFSKYPFVDLVFTDGILIDDVMQQQRLYSQMNKIFIREEIELYPLDPIVKIFKIDGKVRESLFRGNFISMSTVIVRKKCLEKVGLFDVACFGMEDLDLWIRIAGNSHIFVYLYQTTAKCYWRAESLSMVSKDRVNKMIQYYETRFSVEQYQGMEFLVDQNLYNNYKQLILLFANQWKPRDSVKTFLRSLKVKFYPSLFLYALLSFAGPIPIWVKLHLVNPLFIALDGKINR